MTRTRLSVLSSVIYHCARAPLKPALHPAFAWDQLISAFKARLRNEGGGHADSDKRLICACVPSMCLPRRHAGPCAWAALARGLRACACRHAARARWGSRRAFARCRDAAGGGTCVLSAPADPRARGCSCARSPQAAPVTRPVAPGQLSGAARVAGPSAVLCGDGRLRLPLPLLSFCFIDLP